MTIYLTIFFAALAAAAVLMPLAKKLSLRLKLVDDPKKDALKVHKDPIPFLGGGAMALAFMAVLFLVWLAKKDGLIDFETPKLIALAAGGVISWFYGFWDDSHWQQRIKMGQKAKIILQIPVVLSLSLVLFLANIQWQFVAVPAIQIAVAAFYFLFIMNAVNIEDGLDGLLGGLAFISSVGFLLLGIVHGDALGISVPFALAGVTLAFLFFNWHPASIFMGNNGSYFLGFLMAFLAISSTSSGNLGGLLAPLLVVGMPLFNAGFVFSRRAVLRQPIFSADRHHFYDKLNAIFRSVPKSVLANYAIHAAFVGFGLAVAAGCR